MINIKFYRDYRDIKEKFSKTTVAIGNFDGLHLGHQKIIDELIKNSKIKNCPSAILSFKPHPRQFFSDKYRNFQIISEEEKIYLLDKQGIDHYFSLLFDENIASMSPKDFITTVSYTHLRAHETREDRVWPGVG